MIPIAQYQGYGLADVSESDMSHMQVRPAIDGVKNAQFLELVIDLSPGQLRFRNEAVTETTVGVWSSAYGGTDFK